MYEIAETTEVINLSDLEPENVFEDEISEDAWNWAHTDEVIPW